MVIKLQLLVAIMNVGLLDQHMLGRKWIALSLQVIVLTGKRDQHGLGGRRIARNPVPWLWFKIGCTKRRMLKIGKCPINAMRKLQNLMSQHVCIMDGLPYMFACIVLHDGVTLGGWIKTGHVPGACCTVWDVVSETIGLNSTESHLFEGR